MNRFGGLILNRVHAATIWTILILLAQLAGMPSAIASADIWKAEGWKTDFSQSTIEFGEILSGGPPKDGIPAIDEPAFAFVGDIKTMAETEPVMSLTIGNDNRAYPLKILIWHEIVNDVVGGVPVTVTYCPLCNSSLVFERRVDGAVLDFGTTGKLRNSDLVMYDRQTESWWQQFTGEAIVGSFSGKRLKFVPARLEAYRDYAKRHPHGKVLIPASPAQRDYGRNPYSGYDTSALPFLYNGAMPEGIDPLARVVVIRRTGHDPVIVSMALVREKTRIEIGGFSISWKSGQASALDSQNIASGRDVGTIEVIKLADKELAAYDVAFAFAAHAFHPAVEILK